jgi:hypothetical protein
MVSEIEMDEATGKERRTFRIKPGAPQRSSYASTIAEQHGISFPQLEQLFRQRGIMPASVSPAPCNAPQPAGFLAD